MSNDLTNNKNLLTIEQWFNEIKNELTIKQIKENIKYLNELLNETQDEIFEFEIRKQIKYELNLLKTRINKYE